MTLDQLVYVLERKYKNIIIGNDLLVVCTSRSSDDGRFMINNDDAHLVRWVIPNIMEPTQEQLEEWWDKLKEQYNSDPTRVDSDMYKIINPKSEPPIVEEIDI